MSHSRLLRVLLSFGILGLIVDCDMLGALPGPRAPSTTAPANADPTATRGSTAGAPDARGDEMTAQRRVQQWRAAQADAGHFDIEAQGRFVVGWQIYETEGPDGMSVAVGAFVIATDEGLIEEPEPCSASSLAIADLDADGRQDLLVDLSCADQGRGPQQWFKVVADRTEGPVSIPVLRAFTLAGVDWSSRLGKKVTLDVLEVVPCMDDECAGPESVLGVFAWDGSELGQLASSPVGKLTPAWAFPEGDSHCAKLAKTGGTSKPWVTFDAEGQGLASKCKCPAAEGMPGLYCCPFASEEEDASSISTCPTGKPKAKTPEKKRPNRAGKTS